MPYYRNGKIEGIIGYFVEETDNNMLGKVDSYMDEVTGALNMKGLLDIVQDYVDSYIMHRKDFDIYYIDIVNFRHFVDSNGVRLSTRVLQEVVNKIKEVVGVTGTVARIGGDHFVVLKSVTTDEEDMQLQEEIKEEVYNIRRIDHVPCTIYLTIESEKFSEVENMEKIIEHLIREVIRADVHK
jgi:diguanylate cyclase (GGDEF)-like protein